MLNKNSIVTHIKSLDEQGRFAGYASVFNIVDSQRDVVTKGAFKRSIHNRVHEIKLLWQHQQDEPIGIFEKMFEDARGLYVEGKLLLNVRRAKEAHTLLKAGALSGLSIGYSPVHFQIDKKTGIRAISQVDLWEVSLMTFPANEAANVTVVKSVCRVKSLALEALQAHARELRHVLQQDVREQDARGSYMTQTEKLERSLTIASLRRQSQMLLTLERQTHP